MIHLLWLHLCRMIWCGWNAFRLRTAKCCIKHQLADNVIFARTTRLLLSGLNALHAQVCRLHLDTALSSISRPLRNSSSRSRLLPFQL